MNQPPLTPVVIDEARAQLPAGADQKPITVIGTEPIQRTFDQNCLQQAIVCRQAPGVTDLVINPDAHGGHGVPVGCVMVLLINAVVLEAFQEVFPGIQGELIYYISHNIAKQENVDGNQAWVHRKGATWAFPAGHPELADTCFATTGHPILLPGDPVSGSAVMVAEPGAADSCFSINHGAGRLLSRSAAKQQLEQVIVDHQFHDSDILSNCRHYPKDEAPAVYKDFNEVLRSVELAGLAREVARLSAKFVIKDGGGSSGGDWSR